MKTLYTLTTIALIALSLSSKADDKIKNREKTSVVPVAPFIWGDPETAAPDGIKCKAINALVPVAPFVWGSPEDAHNITEIRHLLVPNAQFTFGEPDADIPVDLKFIKAKNAMVPVAPFVWGNSEEAAPEL
ncbi:hypothetical protein [Daejeonella sp.]|uniref:hypothetical protein n=1 Tax=Daejeonella sp. TaxID=2805397 RepID=UPI003983C3F2